MTYDEVINNFKFYRYNEAVFLESEKYLYISKKNKDAYSFCFSNLLINICSDFECLCKKYFQIKGNKRINELILLIGSDPVFKGFFAEKISYIGTDYNDLEPLLNDGTTFSWWSKYNDIKHDKLNNISVASQETVINALAALYALNMYVLHKVAFDENKPDVFLRYDALFTLSNLKTTYVFPGRDCCLEIKN